MCRERAQFLLSLSPRGVHKLRERETGCCAFACSRNYMELMVHINVSEWVCVCAIPTQRHSHIHLTQSKCSERQVLIRLVVFFFCPCYHLIFSQSANCNFQAIIFQWCAALTTVSGHSVWQEMKKFVKSERFGFVHTAHTHTLLCACTGTQRRADSSQNNVQINIFCTRFTFGTRFQLLSKYFSTDLLLACYH